MIYTDKTKKAIRLCYKAHEGQVDKSGMPYVTHPLHLAEQMEDEDSTVAALLHDVVEDTQYTIEDLESMGFGETVTDALKLLTHDNKVPYLEYVRAIRSNPVAKKVKLADLAHNSDLTRLDHEPTAKDLARVEKYQKAREILLEEDDLDANGLTEKEFLAQYNSDKYPKPSLTADILIFKIKGHDDPQLLLIRRKGHPFKDCWALPGGFAEKGETIEQTAARELEEETGITGMSMELVGVYSRPGRDPRGWTVTAAYMAAVEENQVKPAAGDDAKEVCWAKVMMTDGMVQVFTDNSCINDDLAFDHYEIISDAAHAFYEERVREKY